MGQRAHHWNRLYETSDTDRVSWFQSDPAPSLRAIALCGARSLSVIDIGGGASRLAGALLDQRRHDVTVLDISKRALALARVRLGEEGRRVAWIAKDITRWQPHRQWDIWHDRAVFHFLTEDQDRQAYMQALHQAVPKGGHVILASFAPEGPETCSGLPVRRYTPEGLQAELGEGYDLMHSWAETHATPAGNMQAFTWCVFQKL
ncbi:class I SAM-dependent methyltransferase [Pseudophaeobacter arcticus]|uniref:class I SAM-dependent methyltransferase n=1 Tax=Pseudophaeobacter arcticus TaxID=385492 RepID=UPI003A974122